MPSATPIIVPPIEAIDTCEKLGASWVVARASVVVKAGTDTDVPIAKIPAFVI